MTTGPANPAQSVGRRATRGVAIMSAKTILMKGVSTVGQLIVAALLLDDAFGIIAIAFTIRAYAALIQDAGIREVLIAKQHRVQRWANAGFWLVLFLGIAAMFLMALAAFPVASFLDQPALIGVTLVMALSQPAQAITMVGQAMVEGKLRFKTSAIIEAISQTLQVLVLVAAAYAGLGAYSFALGVVVMEWTRMLMLMRAGKPRIRRRLDAHRWPVFIKAALPMTGSAFLERTLQQADYAVLALLTRSESAVGQYFFAFNQSTVMAQLFVQSLVRVLLSGLSTMINEPIRQVSAFLRAISLVALLAMPAAILQGTIARPFLTLLFGDKWLTAVPLLEILSLAAGIAAVAWPSQSLLMAQQRYATRFKLRLAGAIGFVACTTGGGLAGLQIEDNPAHAAIGVAIGVVFFRLFYGPASIWVACRPAGTAFTRVIAVLAKPLAGSLLTLVPAALAVRGVIDASEIAGWHAHALHLVASPPLGLVAYWLWCKTVQKKELTGLRAQLSHVLPARIERKIPAWLF